jgi:hypothetical protein
MLLIPTESGRHGAAILVFVHVGIVQSIWTGGIGDKTRDCLLATAAGSLFGVVGLESVGG